MANPLQYSCLGNPHGQWNLAGCRPKGCKESNMTEHMYTGTHTLSTHPSQYGASTLGAVNGPHKAYSPPGRYMVPVHSGFHLCKFSPTWMVRCYTVCHWKESVCRLTIALQTHVVQVSTMLRAIIYIIYWERLKAGEGDDRRWDGWMAPLTRWTWVWASSRSWWWTRRPGMLQSMGLQRVRYDWATELTDLEKRVTCWWLDP